MLTDCVDELRQATRGPHSTSAAPVALSLLQQRAVEDEHYEAYVRMGASDAQLLDAGFFDDGMPCQVSKHPSWATHMPTTPVGKLLSRVTHGTQRILRGERTVVLLSTGSFSPVHRGHISMMEQARQCLERRGHFVLGGYLSPSHDDYVGKKQGGAAAMHCEHRIALLEEAVADSDWLQVCSWEARYAPTALNFTDVLRRLQAYLGSRLSWQVDVAYVFGSDNERFFHAFEGRGLAVCVDRDEAVARRSCTALSGESTPRWYRAPSISSGSSTQVRAGDLGLLPPAIVRRYEELRRPRRLDDQTSPGPLSAASTYLVREDLDHACEQWPEVDAPARVEFEAQLLSILQAALREAQPPVTVQGLPLAEQKRVLSELLDCPVDARAVLLSLDACIPLEARLDVSRQFEMSGGQVFSKTLVARPGHLPVPQQLLALLGSDVKRVRVVDDDRASGFTQRAVEALFSTAGVAIDGFLYLNEELLRRQSLDNTPMVDIVDARDFLLGAQDGGLVVDAANGAPTRVPYMFPFVNLVFRAKLPPEQVYAISISLWELNASWLARYAATRSVMDLPTEARVLWREMGFSPTTPLSEVAAQMARWLLCCLVKQP